MRIVATTLAQWALGALGLWKVVDLFRPVFRKAWPASCAIWSRRLETFAWFDNFMNCFLIFVVISSLAGTYQLYLLGGMIQHWLVENVSFAWR